MSKPSYMTAETVRGKPVRFPSSHGPLAEAVVAAASAREPSTIPLDIIEEL